MALQLTVIDFETFWDTGHSLTKMSPMEYVTHPKTELISVSIKVGNYPTDVIFGEDKIKHALGKLDWSTKYAIAHNMSGFDAMIMAWRLGIQPKMWGCTLAMARPIHAKTTGLGLGKLVQHYGLGVKDQTILHNTKGKNLADFTTVELEAMAKYNREDTEQCAALFHKLKGHYTARELWHIDAKIRALVEPQFELDTAMLEAGLALERDNKRKTILRLGKHLRKTDNVTEDVTLAETVEELEEAVRSHLASAPKFSELLKSLGVETPMKPSPTNPDKQVPALAKTDEAFIELQNHEDDLVAAAARARLSVKSTLAETRMQAFLDAAKASNGRWPVTTHYCGADTTGRASGWHYNPLNLPRIDTKKPKVTDALRNSIMAPAGREVVVSDLSGIELRVNHFLWQVASSMELYQADPEHADLYKSFAAVMFNKDAADIDKNERQFGKLCIAEGQRVLTHKGLVPIEKVTASHKVWDGIEWVSTLGAVCKGTKDVITYDGLTATADHEVWVADGRKIPFGVAASQLLRLARTGAGGTPLGFSGAGIERDSPREGVQECVCSVYRVPEREVGQLRQLESGQDTGLPELPTEIGGAHLDASANGVGSPAMHQPERPGLRSVRGSGGGVHVSNGGRSGCVGDEQPWPGADEGAGSDRQQRPLRTGQFAVGDAQAERSEPAAQPIEGLPRIQTEPPGSEVRGQHSAQPAIQGADRRTNRGALGAAVLQTQRRVWDLLECGPRHRFTCEGKLVSNCQLGLGFGAGPSTFQKVARVMGGLRLSDEESKSAVSTWRAAYAEIVAGWKTSGKALLAVIEGAEVDVDPWGLVKTCSEGFRLPSGRLIRYPGLHKERDGVWNDGREKYSLFYGEGRHKARITGPKAVENIVQALARDVIYDVAFDVFKETGFRPGLEVYDELAYSIPTSDVDDFSKVLNDRMRQPPKWWPELITWSEGDHAKRYGYCK